MREGWQTKTLGELCVLTSGGTPSKSNPRFWIGDIPFVSARDLKSDRIDTALLHISHEAIEKSATKLAPIGSLLMLVRGMGLANGIQVGEVTASVAFNQDIRALHPPLDSVLPRFLLLALRNTFVNGEGERVLSSAAHGTLKIDTDVLRAITLPLPSLPEQQRIVSIIDEAFDDISIAKDNTEKNLKNAHALFKSYLESVFTQRGAEWERLDLETLLERNWILSHLDGNHGSDYPRKEEFVSEGVPYISANCLDDAGVDMSRAKFLSPARAKLIRKGIARNNDVLFAHNATVGPVAILRTDEPKVILGTSLTYYRCNPNYILPEYLIQYMRSTTFETQYVQVMRQSTRNQVPITKQREFWHVIPPLEEQKQIIVVLDGLLESTQRLSALYERKLSALEILKRSLLHQAFTGNL